MIEWTAVRCAGWESMRVCSTSLPDLCLPPAKPSSKDQKHNKKKQVEEAWRKKQEEARSEKARSKKVKQEERSEKKPEEEDARWWRSQMKKKHEGRSKKEEKGGRIFKARDLRRRDSFGHLYRVEPSCKHLLRMGRNQTSNCSRDTITEALAWSHQRD